mmetsp:Transcript_3205/g.4734  ORF Transcript_3205/g.4734 Transcript_3205/m.4734 type:complete len:182 (+) Transcript_3205:13-558(+)
MISKLKEQYAAQRQKHENEKRTLVQCLLFSNRHLLTKEARLYGEYMYKTPSLDFIDIDKLTKLIYENQEIPIEIVAPHLSSVEHRILKESSDFLMKNREHIHSERDIRLLLEARRCEEKEEMIEELDQALADNENNIFTKQCELQLRLLGYLSPPVVKRATQKKKCYTCGKKSCEWKGKCK